MVVMADTSLRQIREGIPATREAVIRKTRSVSIGTIRNAEKGKRVTNDTAQQLLEAVNALLTDAGKEPVKMEDLDLKLY